MSNEQKRQRININLGSDHQTWLNLASEFQVKPTTLAAALLKSVIAEYNEGKTSDIKKSIAMYVSPSNSSTKEIKLRLHEDEIAALDLFADKIGKNRHQALIAIIRSFVASETQFSLDEIDTLRASNLELNHIGVNLNQIAHRTNTVDFDRINDSKRIAQLVKNLTVRTNNLNEIIKKHVAKVWLVLNAGRYRTDLMQAPLFKGKTSQSNKR